MNFQFLIFCSLSVSIMWASDFLKYILLYQFLQADLRLLIYIHILVHLAFLQVLDILLFTVAVFSAINICINHFSLLSYFFELYFQTNRRA